MGGCDSCGESVGNKDGVDQMDKNKSRTDLLAAGRKKVFLVCFVYLFYIVWNFQILNC